MFSGRLRSEWIMNLSPTHKVFGLLMVGATVGGIGVLPYALELTGVIVQRIPPAAYAVAVLQTMVLSAIASAVGLRLGDKLGLGAPDLKALVIREEGATQRLRSQLTPSVIAGALTGLALIVLDRLVFMPRVPAGLRELGEHRPAAWKGLLASFYGGIVEELLLRLGLMTVLVWIGTKLARTPRPSESVLWLSSGLAALLFGVGHLPATAARTPLTPTVVARALVLNGAAGIVLGRLYWRRGLFAAMLAHFTADLVLHVLPVPFPPRQR